MDLPPVMTFLHLIELADAVEILLESSSVHPAKLLLRSMFEATLTIEYLFKADTKRRCFAWLVCRAHRELSAYEVMSSNTQAGGLFRRESENDEIEMDLELVPQEDLDEAIANLRQLLRQDNYAEAEAEYRRLSKRRKPEWHSFYGGPITIRDLAKTLGQLRTYQFLYKTWSELVHAGDGGRWLTKTSSGQPAFHALRNPVDFLQVANVAISLLLSGMMCMVKRYAPSSDLTTWYKQDLRPDFVAMRKITINVAPKELDDSLGAAGRLPA